MNAVRRFSLLASTGLLCIAVMLGWVSARPSISRDAVSQLSSSLSYFDSTIVLARNARPRGPNGDALALSLGYLERERRGMGSPFRLVDEALQDPRLDSASRVRTAWALLGRLRRNEAYVVDPVVLDGVGPWSRDGRGAIGLAHLRLIEGAIERASDPRAGELSVRLAYTVAAGKGSVASTAPGIATEVAALVRDRHLAAADLRELLAASAQLHEDALDIVVARRASRSFAVEQPPLAPLSAELRVEAMNAVPALLAALDTLDQVAPASSEAQPQASLIDQGFAARLAVLGARQPVMAQVAVTVRGHPQGRLDATNEETLVAAAALRIAAADSTERASAQRAAARAVLSTAVSLRAFNQSFPWFVGSSGPSAADLSAEFGLGAVEFSRSVPGAWRPYYLRELANALRDMQTVLPALSVQGLNVHFANGELPDSALAMHDPRTRTLKLTINSSSGTLAHELSHDLDWQTARRLFASGGGYSSDRAIREHRGTLASSMRGLAEARMLRSLPAGKDVAALPDRPAELFARGADWFTATTLALTGRTNGFLTAVQDAGIAGYAAGAPTAIGSAGAASLISAIDQMTYIPDSAQNGFESIWSDAATIDPLLMVRRVFSTPVGRIVVGARGEALSLPQPHAQLCMSTATDESRARARLIELAVDSRARGIAMRRARYRFGNRPDWTNSVLGIAPWEPRSADPVIAAIRNAIIGELRNAPADQGVLATVPAGFESNCHSRTS